MDSIPHDSLLSQRPPNGSVFIYGMRHPRTKDIRYVGKTRQSLRARLQGHLHEKGETRKVRWIATLKAEDLLPEIFLIQIVDETLWEEAETRWITSYRAQGCDLVNLTDGGDGVHNPAEESRQRLSESRKQMFADPDFKAKMLEVTSDPERRAKIAQSLSGKPKSPEHVAKLPQNQPGRKLGEKQRQNIRQASLKRIAQEKENGIVRGGKPLLEEHKAKIAETLKGRPGTTLGRVMPEHEKLQRSLANKGQKRSEATKEKIRLSKIGKKRSVTTIEKIKETKRLNRERKLREAKDGISFHGLWETFPGYTTD